MTVAKPVFSKHAGLCDISKDSMWPYLPIEAQGCFSHKNQSFGLHCKSDDWFLCRTQHWDEIG